MTEPTIDEMLNWLKRFDYTAGHYPKAICAILEQHRESEVNRFKAIIRLEEDAIIRAFVERVEKRVNDLIRADPLGSDVPYAKAIQDELAAMEKEAE